MKSASTEGKNWKPAHPPSTIPTVKINVETPPAAVTYRQRSSTSKLGL